MTAVTIRSGYPTTRKPDPTKAKVRKKIVEGRRLERYKMNDAGNLQVMHATKGWRKT
jgi:hypothetical protein